MRVVLVAPPYDGAHRIPLGALILKRTLTAEGNRVELVDFSQDYESELQLNTLHEAYGPFPGLSEKDPTPLGNIQLWEDTLIRRYLVGGDLPFVLETYLDKILVHEPRLVGFSIQNSFEVHNPLFLGQLLFSLGLARAIKLRDSKVTVVFGGSALYSEEQNREIMTSFQFVDGLVRGEGEIPLQMIIRRLSGERGNCADIPGVLWRNGGDLEEGTSVLSAQPPISAPDYSGFDLNRYRRAERLVLPMELSRGCPWGKCTYCSFPLQGRYRKKPVSEAIDEIGRHLATGLTDLFLFVDNAVTPQLAFQFADRVLSSGMQISYALLARPTVSFTAGVLEKMAASGCRIILWGGETFSTRMVRAIRKGTRVDEVGALMERSHSAGIFNYLFYIFGLPEQTTQDLIRDKAFFSTYGDKISAVLPNYFRLDRESPYFRDLYRGNADRLVPIFGTDTGTVYSLLCKADHDQNLVDYFRENLAPMLTQEFVQTDERDLLRILKNSPHVTVDNVKSIADLESLLNPGDDGYVSS